MEEELHISINEIEKNKITIEKKIETIPFKDTQNLESTSYSIQRVNKDILLDEVPEVKETENVTILPVFKEGMVKKILLVEEIHITKNTVSTENIVEEELRKEVININKTKV